MATQVSELHAMFPAMGREVIAAVLDSCGNSGKRAFCCYPPLVIIIIYIYIIWYIIIYICLYVHNEGLPQLVYKENYDLFTPFSPLAPNPFLNAKVDRALDELLTMSYVESPESHSQRTHSPASVGSELTSEHDAGMPSLTTSSSSASGTAHHPQQQHYPFCHQVNWACYIRFSFNCIHSSIIHLRGILLLTWLDHIKLYLMIV